MPGLPSVSEKNSPIQNAPVDHTLLPDHYTLAMPRVDLHTHSTASDGSLPPGAIVREAKKAKLVAVALTDHDTVAGLAEFMDAGGRLGIETVPGVELAVGHPEFGSLDILGLWVPLNSAGLRQALDELNQAREARNGIILRKLNKLGLNISMDDVRQQAGPDDGTVGRPHIAQALVAKKYVKSVSHAFERYLRDDGPAYASKRILSPADGIRLLTSVGATTLLAHPCSYPRVPQHRLEELLRELQAAGLDGLETYYPDYGPERTRMLMVLAERLGLAMSGGSDYHGAAKPEVRLGTGRGNFGVPSLVLDNLKKLRRQRGQPL